MQRLTDTQTVDGLKQAIETAKTLEQKTDDMCQLCFGTGYAIQIIDGYRTAVKCSHDPDQHRERIAIEVEHLENAQEIYESRI